MAIVNEMLTGLLRRYHFTRVENVLSHMGCGMSHDLMTLWRNNAQIPEPIAIAILIIVVEGLASNADPSTVVDDYLPTKAANVVATLVQPH